MFNYKILLSFFFLFTSLFASTNEKVSLQLIWKHQFEFAGFYIAKEKGFYDEVGLDVEFKEYNNSINIAKDVSEAKSTYGIGYPSVILDKINGANIHLLSAILQSSPHTFVSLESSGIKTLDDFKDKKVMINKNAVYGASLMAMLKTHNISIEKDMKAVPTSFQIDDLINGKVDIKSCFLSNEPFLLEKENIPYKVWDPKDYGFEFYDLLLFTSSDELQNHPARAESFRKASLKGWKYAFENIDEAIELILKKYNTQNKTKEALLYEAKIIKELAFYKTDTIGTINKHKIQRIIDVYNFMGLVSNKVDLDDFIYNKPLNTTNTNRLTQEEKNWIENNTIKVGISPWHPITYLDKKTNSFSGVGFDIFDAVVKKLNLQIEYIPNSWSKLLKEFKDGAIDVLPTTFYTQERDQFGYFSQPYLDIKEQLFVKKDSNINGFEDLKNKKIAILKDYGAISKIKAKYPTITIVQTATLKESIELVLTNQADAVFNSQFNISSFLKDNFIYDLKPLYQIDFKPSPLHFLIDSNNIVLQKILEKGLESFSYKEKNTIISKWIDIKEDIFKKTNDFLTQEQKNYLNNKKQITMCIDPSWMPFESFKDGEYIGMTADYFKVFKDDFNLPIQVVKTDTWSQSIDFAKSRKCDILSLAMQTPQRSKYLNFTTPYLKIPLVIATKHDVSFISDFKTLVDEKIGIPKGYAFVELLKIKYPNINIIEVKNIQDGLQQVKEGKLFGYIGTLASVGYMFQKEFTGELKIAGKFDENWELGIAVRDDDLMLLSILESSVNHIDQDTHRTILNKWIAIKYEKRVDYTILWQIAIVVLVLVLFFIYRQILLKKTNTTLQELVKDKTKELQEFNESLENKVQQRTQELNSSKLKLKESYNEMRHILDSTMEAIFIFEDGYCIDVNNEAIKLYGYPNKEAMLGKTALSLVTQEYLDLVKEHIRNNYKEPYEIDTIKSDGSHFPTLVRGSSFIKDGKNLRITTGLDLTDLKSKESLLVQQSKMAALGEMLANISHQWRQPLSVISTVASGMKLKLEYDMFNKEEEIKNLDILVDSTSYLSATIDDFKNFLNPEKINKTFTIKKVIDKTLQMFGKNFTSHGIEIITDIDDSQIVGNDNELLQVIINIINNSKDILNQKDLDKKLIFIDLHKTSSNITLSIKDNGGGIDESILTKIFDAYFTTKHKSIGTGIGLYMSYQIIKNSFKGDLIASNEKFIFENKEYQGAKFTISLGINSKD